MKTLYSVSFNIIIIEEITSMIAGMKERRDLPI